MQCNCVTGGLLVNWWPSQCCSNSAAPTSPWLVATSHPDEHFSAMENYWPADYDVRDRFKGKSWVEQVRGWTGQGSAGWTWSSRRPTTPASTTSSTGATVASVDNLTQLNQVYSTDRNFNHDCRDDKKRKAFQRGGPQKPKVQPAYEKVFLKIFTLHLLFSIQELIEKFHTESKARWQNLTCLLSSSIKSWESNCTSDV